ncbi:hypothetical protein T484DRAFT_1755060 [Baffinella frigidus]|jgi:hypothetical protein|nr:hypothetical protein T484DRAFT_1755060 [Cryptophyta sp. CCMP2293]
MPPSCTGVWTPTSPGRNVYEGKSFTETAKWGIATWRHDWQPRFYNTCWVPRACAQRVGPRVHVHNVLYSKHNVVGSTCMCTTCCISTGGHIRAGQFHYKFCAVGWQSNESTTCHCISKIMVLASVVSTSVKTIPTLATSTTHPFGLPVTVTAPGAILRPRCAVAYVANESAIVNTKVITTTTQWHPRDGFTDLLATLTSLEMITKALGGRNSIPPIVFAVFEATPRSFMPLHDTHWLYDAPRRPKRPREDNRTDPAKPGERRSKCCVCHKMFTADRE